MSDEQRKQLKEEILINECLIKILDKKNHSSSEKACLEMKELRFANESIIDMLRAINLWPSTEVDGERFDLVGVE